MGITTITAARIYDGQLKDDVKYGEENVLSWETFPWTALAKTYHVDLQGTDSATAATAFLCGIKTNSGMLSTVIRSNTYIEDITRWREDMNFMFEWQQQYLTSERSERVRYCSCHENIKFISSSHRVMFFLLYGD